MKPGIHNLIDLEYHAADGVSNSGLKWVSRSPAHFYANCLDPQREPDKVTPAKLAGKCLHTAILEPHLFNTTYAILPADAPKRPTKAQYAAKNPSPSSVQSMQWWDNWNLANSTKTEIKAADAIEYQKIAAIIRTHPELKGLMAQGDAEQSIFAVDPVTGVLVRVRTDFRTVFANHQITIDLKSTEDARDHPFRRDAYNFGYFQGAAFYTDVQEWAGLPKSDIFIFLACEKVPPYALKIYEVREHEMERGREQYRKALDLYAECLKADKWPPYNTAIEPLYFPTWAKD